MIEDMPPPTMGGRGEETSWLQAAFFASMVLGA